MHLRKSANAPWKRRLRSAIKKDWRPRALHFKRGYVLLWEAETITFQMQPEAAILSAKSGISNHAASNIPDHLCFSKFGTFHVACPQTADNLRTFVCAPCWHQKVRSLSVALSDTPRGLSKRGKTQNSMSDAARKKSSDFASKNCRLWLHSGTSYSPIFL